MSDITGRLSQVRQWGRAAGLAFVVGCGFGWVFRQRLLGILTAPLMDLIYQPGRIVLHEHYAQPIVWPVVAMGLLTAFPFLTLLIWGLIAPRAVLVGQRMVTSFVCCSYVMVALGVWSGLAVLPNYVAMLLF